MARPRPLRADAARNREKLLAAATRLFGERGLDVPMEHIARRAEVSIGTLYAHFPTRDAFFEAIFPERLAALETLGEKALAEPDPWQGFVGYLEGVFAMHATDLRIDCVLADRSSVHDVAALRRTTDRLGARLQLADVAMGDGTPRHHPAKLATALSEVLGAT